MRVKCAIAGVAVVGVVVSVSGCGQSEGAQSGPTTPTTTAAPVTTSGPPPTPARVADPFKDLEARVRQATADAAESGANVEIVAMDRDTGEIVSNGDDQPFPIASVVKLFIADDLLLQVSKGETTLTPADRKSLDVMLRSSDDSAAQIFWDRSGGNDVIARIKARYGLAETTAPYNGHWDVTTSTSSDLVRYYDMLLDGTGGLPREQADVIMGDLSKSTPTGIDGYPQRFGIPDGLYDEPVAVKQGWFCCWSGANQLHVSTGVIGADRRFIIAIGSLQPVDEATARDTMTQVVKTMFPGGRI